MHLFHLVVPLLALLPTPGGPDGDFDFTIQLVNAGTKEPIASAAVWSGPLGTLNLPDRFGPAPKVPPGPAGKNRPVTQFTNEEGRVTLPLFARKNGAAVVHENGIGWIPPRALRENKVEVTLQPWARLEGIVTKPGGQPVAGAEIQVERRHGFGNIGNEFFFQSPPMTHQATAKTGPDGRFIFERLIPTGENSSQEFPYQLSEVVGGGFSLGRGDVTLPAGQTTELELDGIPRCEVTVSGRLLWADGTPVLSTKDAPVSLTFAPWWNGRSSSMISAAKLAEGRFSQSLPVSGPWRLTLSQGRADAIFQDGDSGYEFLVPEQPGPALDLGDIWLQEAPARAEDAPNPAVDANGDARFRVQIFDSKMGPISGASVAVESLESSTVQSTNYFYPRNLTKGVTGADGWGEVTLPWHFSNPNDPKVWPITGAFLTLRHPGFAVRKVQVKRDKAAVRIGLLPLSVIEARATLDGKPLPAEAVSLVASWDDRPPETGGGVLKYTGIPRGTWNAQAAHRADDGWRYFSAPALVESRPGETMEAAFTLTRGERLAGRLDAAVPRPIKGGIARVVIMPETPRAMGRALIWSDWVALAEDGSFLFKGLPPGRGWIATACEGWISDSQGPIAGPRKMRVNSVTYTKAFSVDWQARNLPAGWPNEELEVPMVQTGNAAVTFVTAAGMPVVNTRPAWHAQLSFGGEWKENLESASQSLDQRLIRPRTGYRMQRFSGQLDPQTDADGRLELRGLPPGLVRFGLYQWKLDVPAADPKAPQDMLDRLAPFRLEVLPGEMVETKITVAPAR